MSATGHLLSTVHWFLRLVNKWLIWHKAGIFLRFLRLYSLSSFSAWPCPATANSRTFLVLSIFGWQSKSAGYTWKNDKMMTAKMIAQSHKDSSNIFLGNKIYLVYCIYIINSNSLCNSCFFHKTIHMWGYKKTVTFTHTCTHTSTQAQEMNLDTCELPKNTPPTHTHTHTHTHSEHAFIYIMDYVGHHRGGLFFLLQLICAPYSFYTYK